MISVLNEQLSASDQEKKKLIDEFIEWQNNVHKEDVERLKSIQNSGNSILNTLKKLDDEIDRTHTEISKVEDAVKGFESKWETDKRKKLIAKYKTAEKLQRERRFDEAQKYYQDVLINGGQDPEVYWRVLMCHYCIEYQRNDEGKEIPTILYPDLSDPNEVMERINLLEILDSTDRELREYYCTKLKAIDTILDKYRRWQYKLQYDVFISVKQTDRANGKRHPTEDYKVGRDLYEYLTSLGLRVFNSECVTKLAGEEWEPYILAALMSARVMIVVGTCPEYMEAQWVKNEWTRYQWLQKFEKDTNKKRILFCYLSGGMSPEELPKGLNPGKEVIVDGLCARGKLEAFMGEVFPHILNEQKSSSRHIPTKQKNKLYIVILLSISVAIYSIIRLSNGLPLWPIFVEPIHSPIPTSMSPQTPTLAPITSLTPTPTPTPTPTSTPTPTLTPIPTSSTTSTDSQTSFTTQARISALQIDQLSIGKSQISEVINRYGKTTHKVNFRKEASIYAEKHGVLNKDAYVYMICALKNEDTSWTCIMVNGTIGYVMTEFLEEMSLEDSETWNRLQSTAAPVYMIEDFPLSTSTSKPENATVNMINRYGKTTHKVNCRQGPSKDYLPISQLSKNAYVYMIFTQIKEDTPWTYVMVNSKYGYIMSEFLEELTPEESAAWDGAQATSAPIFSLEELNLTIN